MLSNQSIRGAVAVGAGRDHTKNQRSQAFEISENVKKKDQL